MLSLMAVIQKELLLLLRDRAGLLVLFLMPAMLVVIITLVQENAMQAMGATDTRILLINQDAGDLGGRIVDALAATEGVVLVREIDGRVPARSEAMDRVAAGEYPLCLIIPPQMTERVRARAREAVAASLAGETAATANPVPHIEVRFDPAVMGGLRSAVERLLAMMTLRIETAEKIRALGASLPAAMNRSLAAALEPLGIAPPAVDFHLHWPEASLLGVANGGMAADKAVRLPTSVQQNVPAWTLFGVFFIVLPMSGAFIQERLNGTRRRLATMPAGYPILIGGRAITYAGVCTLQCLLIGGIGKWLLPLWGAPGLEITGSVMALAIILAAAVLAATGYGILLGSVVDTYQQAAMFGPISVVIAAALGGIMVPVYAMPAFMQKISIISPLGWGLNGVLDVFVRQGTVVEVLPEAAALGAFCLGCLIVAWWWQRPGRMGRRSG